MFEEGKRKTEKIQLKREELEKEEAKLHKIQLCTSNKNKKRMSIDHQNATTN